MKQGEKYLSVIDYAKACGVSPQQIYNRLRTGAVAVDVKESDRCAGAVIDIDAYPPLSKQSAGRKKVSDTIQQPNVNKYFK